MTAASKVIFANQLRGVAALCVLLMHYTVVVQLVRPEVAWVIAAPLLDGPIPQVSKFMENLPIDPAATGVGLFFLLSGFVIPYSLEKTKPPLFLLARATRIFPTFWAALLLEWLAVRLSGNYWRLKSPFGWQDYLDNGLLINIILGKGSVDWVSWTLSIEVKFYVLAAMFVGSMRRHPTASPLIVAVVALTMNVASANGLLPLPPRLASESTYLAFIMIGWVFQTLFLRRMTRPHGAAVIIVIMLVVLLCWKFGPLAGEFRGRSRSLAAAVVIFSICFAMRMRFRSSSLLDGIAAISYPLYLIHSVVGFCIVTFVTNVWRLPYPWSAIVALTACIGLATGLHVAVEKPTMRLGHRMTEWRPKRRVGMPAVSVGAGAEKSTGNAR